jgi:hypothetical protein
MMNKDLSMGRSEQKVLAVAIPLESACHDILESTIIQKA